MFAPNWSWKVEYNYMDFRSKDYTFVLTSGPAELWRIDDQLHVVKAGVNYRF
jgi:outer membrane immunogenic protein